MTFAANDILHGMTGSYTGRDGKRKTISIDACKRADSGGYYLSRGDGDIYLVTPDRLKAPWAIVLHDAYTQARDGAFMHATSDLRRIQPLAETTRKPHLAAITASRQHAANTCALIEQCADAWKRERPNLDVLPPREHADRATSAHEAAHAIAGLAAGYPPTYIIADGVEETTLAGVVQWRGSKNITPRQHAVISAAGIVAEDMLGEVRDGASSVPFASDFAHINNLHLSADEIAAVVDEARELLDKHHAAFVALTAQLVMFGQLTAADVEAIVRKADLALHQHAYGRNTMSTSKRSARRKLKTPPPTDLSEGLLDVIRHQRAAILADFPNPIARLLTVAKGNASLVAFIGDVAAAHNDHGKQVAADMLQQLLDANNKHTTEGQRR